MTVETATAVTAGTRVEWAPVPRVNLLPPEILQRRGFVKVQRRLGLGVVAVALLCAGGYWWAASGVSAAQEDLDQATAQGSALNAEKAKYSEVPRVLAQVRAVQAARQSAMAGDILWYRVLNDLAMSTPSTIWIDSATFALAGATGPGGAAAAADPLSPVAVGTVTINGASSGLVSLPGWLESMDALTPIDGSIVVKVEAKQDPPQVLRNEVTFSATAVLAPAALSHRYDVKPE